MSADPIEIAGVRLTHPDRVSYPEQGLTKLDLARYYEAQAERVLPHVAGRPLSVVRCPRGEGEACFYQKHRGDTMAEEIHGVEIEEKSGEVAEYLLIRDLPGLVALVQLGVLELHPWGSREDQIERPDRVVFDLDPGPGVAFPAVVAAARAVAEQLRRLELTSFVRTTGGKGLHVVVPIARRSSWQEVQELARAVAEKVAQSAPERYVVTAKKSERRERIFIDYLRNSRGATAVASYSTRARPGAPVATPLRWDALGRLPGGDAYRVDNLPRRLARLAGDPWEGFFELEQSLTGDMVRALAE